MSKHILPRRARGFTLIEALVALLVLSIGLLGVAGMQLTGLRSNLSASWRSQATYLSYDILERIRANRTARASYATVVGAPALLCDGSASTATCDVAGWKATLGQILPGGDGSVTVGGPDNTVVIVTIQWADAHGEPGATGDEDPVEFRMESRI